MPIYFSLEPPLLATEAVQYLPFLIVRLVFHNKPSICLFSELLIPLSRVRNLAPVLNQILSSLGTDGD